MKKFFTVLLAFSITAAFAGCNKPADEQLIDDITEGTSLLTETSETISETETAAETENAVETVSEKEETNKSDKSVTETETANTEEIITKNPAESKFPIGTWQENYIYTYERDEKGNITYTYYDENENIISNYDYKNYYENGSYANGEVIFQKDCHIYEFDGEGHFRVALQTHDVFGDYTFENNVLTLTFKIDFGDEGVFINRFSFEAVKEENGYQLYFDTSKSTEMIELPAAKDTEQVSYIELSAGLSSLFDTFYKRKSFFIKYAGEPDPNSFKKYIEYIESIS